MLIWLELLPGPLLAARSSEALRDVPSTAEHPTLARNPVITLLCLKDGTKE